jgi:hypothetical protein
MRFKIPFNLPVVSGFLLTAASLITHNVLGKKIKKAIRMQETRKLEQLDNIIKNEFTPETMKEKETVKKEVKTKRVKKEVQSEDSLSK